MGIQVQTDNPMYVRDIHSKALLNTDYTALQQHRKGKASSLNNQKQKITEAIDNKFKELEKLEINQKLKKDRVDVSFHLVVL